MRNYCLPRKSPDILPLYDGELYPEDVFGNVLSLRAKKANSGLVPTLTSGVSSFALFSDMSKVRSVLSYTNLLSNPNFVNTTGWTPATATVSATGNILTLAGDGTGKYPRVTQATSTPYVSGKKIYVRAKVRFSNANCLSVIYGILATGMSTVYSNIAVPPANGTLYEVGAIITLGAGGSGNISIRIETAYSSNENANAASCTIESFMAIDLTTLGYGSLTLAQCNTLFPFTVTTGTSAAGIANDVVLSNLGGTSTSGFIKSPVLSNKGFGVSYNNLVAGNLEDTTGWTGASSVLSTSNNTLTSAGNGGSAFANAYYDTAIDCVVGNRIYVNLLARVTNADCANLYAVLDGSTAGTDVTIKLQATPANGTWYTLYGVGTVGADFTGKVRIKIIHSYADAGTENGKAAEIQQVMSINLSTNTQVTALETALGRNLTAEDCVRIMPFTATSNSVTVDTPYSLTLDGTDDYGSLVNTTSLAAGSNEIILSTTFRIALGAISKWMLSKCEDAENETEYGLKYNATNGNIELWLEGDVRAYTAAASIVQNTWYHVMFYRNSAGNIFVWLNKVTHTGTDYVGALTSRANTRIGARASNAGGTTHTDYNKGDLGTQSIYIASSLDIKKIIKAEMNVSYEYTGVK